MKQPRTTCIHPELGEISVEYSPRRFRAAITVAITDDSVKIILKLPARPYSAAENYFSFLSENTDWIRKKTAELQKKAVSHTYQPGDTFNYLGHPCPLIGDTSTYFDGKAFHVSPHSPPLVRRELEKLYIRLAKEYIIPLCREYANNFGLTVGNIRINKAAKRWGSCNSKGDLNFSYRLIMHSPEFIRYTICHELAHRLHMNHSKAFYAVLQRFYPFPAPKE